MWVAQAFGGGGTSLTTGSGQLGVRPASSDAQRQRFHCAGQRSTACARLVVIVAMRLYFTCYFDPCRSLRTDQAVETNA